MSVYDAGIYEIYKTQDEDGDIKITQAVSLFKGNSCLALDIYTMLDKKALARLNDDGNELIGYRVGVVFPNSGVASSRNDPDDIMENMATTLTNTLRSIALS